MPKLTGGYVNPYKRIHPLALQRIDQGVDFSGNGPVLAIGDAQVVAAQANNTGWPGGGWLVYRLLNGPATGKLVYVAEEITPTVASGQHVKAGDVVAHQHGFTETGWAASASQPVSQTAAAGSISGGNLPGGGANPTRIGKNFDQLLVRLGIGKAPNYGNPPGGRLPSGYPDWSTANLGVSAPVGPSSGGSGSITSDLFGGIAGDLINPITNALGVSSIGDFIERGLLIFVGLVLILIGVWKATSMKSKGTGRIAGTGKQDESTEDTEGESDDDSSTEREPASVNQDGQARSASADEAEHNEAELDEVPF